MGISPLYVGQLIPIMGVQITLDDTTHPNLTGATLSMIIRNRNTGAESIAIGTFTITDAANGKFTYTWVTADTANAGHYDLFVAANTANGPLKIDPIELLVLPT